MYVTPWTAWLLVASLVVATVVIVVLAVQALHTPHPHRSRARRRRPVAILAMTALLLGCTGIPAASADPFCFAGWCGKVAVNNLSAKKCITVVDADSKKAGNLYYLDSDPKTSRQASSTRYMKDTDAFFIRATCKSAKQIYQGRYVKTWTVGKWHRVPSGRSISLVVR